MSTPPVGFAQQASFVGAGPNGAGMSAQQFAQPQTIAQSAQHLLPGVTIVNGKTNTAPLILVISKEKVGKSALAGTTLVGYPDAGKQPLFLSWDATGVDACIKLGYQPHSIPIKNQPGAKNWDKAKGVLQNLEQNVQQLHAQYGAIVTDCLSTMVDRLHEDAARFSQNPNPQSHYGDALMQSKQWINRLVDLGLPTIWLAWLRDAEVVEEKNNAGQKVKKFKMGGPNILGGTRELIAGKAHHILYLEKQKLGPQAPGADEEGYVRILHTRPFENINCHGRYSHLLPEPIMPAHLGFVLGCITGRGPWAPQAQPQAQAQQFAPGQPGAQR